jgi:hypothetical protein
MSALVAIAARELRQRAMWPLFSFAVGFLPFLIPSSRELLRTSGSVVAVPVALLLVTVASLLMGSSVLAGDVVQGRIGFFWSRPVSWWAVWGGKLLAAFALATSSLLVLVPTALFRPDALPGALGPATWALLPCWILIGLTVAQGVVLAVRGGSWWVGLDGVVLLLAAYAAGRVLWSLWWTGAFLFTNTSGLQALLVGALVAMALLAAGAASFAHGGVSIQRAHRAMSATAWSLLFVLFALGGAWAYWAARPRADEFQLVRFAQAEPRGRWLTVFGRSDRSGNQGVLFLDAPSRGGAPVGPAPVAHNPAFAADGRSAAWLEVVPSVRSHMEVEVHLARVNDKGTTRVDTLDFPSDTSVPDAGLAFAPRGDRLAVAVRDTVFVFDVASAHLSLSVPLPASLPWTRVFFADDDHILVCGPARPDSLQLAEVSLGDGRARAVGQIQGRAEQVLFERETATILVAGSKSGVALHDARTGARRATLLESAIGRPLVTFVGGGRVALVGQGPEGTSLLRLFDTNGRLERESSIGTPRKAMLDADAAHARIYMGVEELDGTVELLVLNARTLEIERREAGLWPIHYADTLAREAEHSRIFRDSALSHLVRLDPATGRREILVGKKG